MATLPDGPVAVIRDVHNAGLSVTVHDNSDAHSRFQATLSCIPKHEYEPFNRIHSPITSYFNKDKSFQPDQITYPTQSYDHPVQTNFCNVYQGFDKGDLKQNDSEFNKPLIHLHDVNGGHLYRDRSQLNGNYNYYNCDGKGFARNIARTKGCSRSRSASRSISPNRSNSPNISNSPNRSNSPDRSNSPILSSLPIGSRSIGINSRLCADRGPRARQNELSSFTFQDKYGALVTRPLCSEFPPQRDVPDKVGGNFATGFSSGGCNNHYHPAYQRNVALERSGLAAIENSKFVNSLRKYPEYPRSKCFCPGSFRDIAERLSTYVRTKKVNKSSCHPVKRGQKKFKEKLFGGGVGKATKVTQTYARKYNIHAAVSRQRVLNSIESELRIQGEEEFSEQYDYLKGDSKNTPTMSQRHAQDLEVRYLLDLLKCIKKRMRTLCQPNSQTSNFPRRERLDRNNKIPKSYINYQNMDSSTTTRVEGSSESMNQDTIHAMPALYMDKCDQEPSSSKMDSVNPGSSNKGVKWGGNSTSGDTFTGVCPGCKHAHKHLQERIEAQVKDWSKMLPIQPQEVKEYQIPANVTDNMTRELINTLTCLKIRYTNNDFNVYAKKEISSFISNLPAKLPDDESKRTKLFETLSNKLVEKISHMEFSDKTKEQDKVDKANEEKEKSIIDLEGLARKIVSRLMALDFKCLKELKESKSSLENKISDIISDLPIKLSFRDRNKVFKNSLELFSDCINSFYPKHDKSILESVTDEYKKDLDTYLNKSDNNYGVTIKDNSDESIYKVNFVNTDLKPKDKPLAEGECDSKVFIQSFTRKIRNDIIDLLDKNTNSAESLHGNHTNARPAMKTPIPDDITLDDLNNDKSACIPNGNDVPNENSQEISDQIMDKFRKLSSVKIKKSSLDSVNIKDEQSLKSQSQLETKLNGSDKEKCSRCVSSLGLTKSTSFKIEQFQKNLLEQVESLLKKYTKSDQISKVNTSSGNSVTNDFINKVKEICVGLDSENRQLKELRLRDEIARYMNNISLKSDTSKESLVGQLLKSLEKMATSKDKKSDEGSKTSITTTELYQEVCVVLKNWINTLQIHMSREQKDIVVKKMAKDLYDDITLRKKYKQIYEKGNPKAKEDDICLKYNVYKLVNKTFDLSDLAKIIPRIPDLVDKLQDIEGGYVSGKEIDSDASTSRDINELVEKLCDQLFCSLNPSHNQIEIERMKRNLTNKTVHKLKSLHDDLEIVNDDLLYSSALNEELDNILGSLWTGQSTDSSKHQFKSKLADIISGYKSKRCDESGECNLSYKQQLRNAIENVIFSQDSIRRARNKKNYAIIELFKESLVDTFLNMTFNNDKRRSETKSKFAKEIKQLVSYIKEITDSHIDFDKLKIDLELSLARVPRPNNDVINSELNKLRYKEAITEWLNTLSLRNDSDDDKLERLQQVTLLVKRICDLSKQKTSLPGDIYLKGIKSAVSIFCKNLRKDSNVTAQTNKLVEQLYEQIYNLIETKLDYTDFPKPIQSPLQSMLSLEERALLQRIRERAKNSKNSPIDCNEYPNKDTKCDIAEGQTAEDTTVPQNDYKGQHLVVREYYVDPKSLNPSTFDPNLSSIPTFVSTAPCCGSGPKSSACFSGTGLPPHIPQSQRQAREIHLPYRRPNYVDINIPGRITTRYNYKTKEDNDGNTDNSLEVNIGDREYADDYTGMYKRNQNRRSNNQNQRINLDESGSSDHIYGKDISNIGGNLRPEKARGRFKKMMENTNPRYEKDCPWCPDANYYKNCPKCYAMECPYPSKLYFNHD